MAKIEPILDSKKTTFFWNMLVMERLEKFVEDKAAQLRKKNINNVVDLLKRLHLTDEKIALTLLGWLPIDAAQRKYLGNLFDDNYHKREELQKALRDKNSELRRAKQERFETFDEWEKAKQRIEQLQEEVKALEVSLSVIPARNTVPPGIWSYPKPEDLKKLGLVKDRPNDPTLKRLELTDKGISLMSDSTDMKALVRQGEQLSDDLLLKMWHKQRTTLRGNIPLRSMLASFLGLGKKEKE